MRHRDYISPIQARVDSCLRDLRRLVQVSLITRGISLVLVAIAVVVFVSFGLDRLFRLSHVGRAVTLIIYLGCLARVAWKLLLSPLLVRLTPPSLADLLEKQFPELDDRLRSAVDFLRDPEVGDTWGGRDEKDDLTLTMKRRVAEQAAARIESLETGDVVDTPRVVSALTGGIVAIGAIGLLALLVGSTLGIWFQRQVLFADVDYEYRTGLTLSGFDSDRTLGVPRGDPVEIQVVATKEIPTRVTIRLEYPTGTARYNMDMRPGAESGIEGGVVFVHKHGAVTEDFEFTVEGGDYRTKPHRIRVLERPQVETLRVTSTAPEYTGEKPKVSEGDVGEIAVPEGSRLEIQGKSNKALTSASIETEGIVRELSVDTSDPRTFRGEWRPSSGGVSTIRLEDQEGVPPDRLMQFSIHLIADGQPSVQVRTEGLGPLITSDAFVPLVITARDDYRIDKVSLLWSIEEPKGQKTDGEVELPIADLPSREPLEDVEHVWKSETLKIQPEKRLNIRVGATDNDALTGPKTGFSPILSFLVVTPERLGAEFVRREIEQRRVLERIIAEERKVRDEVYRLIGESWQKEGPIPESDVDEMLQLARVERQHARALESIADAVDQIVAEMENNRLAEADDLSRLRDRISSPLRRLAAEVLPAISTGLGKVREDSDARSRVVKGVELGKLVDDKLEDLDDVLNFLERLEGFTEVVKHLRTIIRTQGESTAAVQTAYEDLVKDVFEDLDDDDSDSGDSEDGDSENGGR